MRFIKMISIIMSDQLRTAVLRSVEAYRGFWQRYDFSLGSEVALAGAWLCWGFLVLAGVGAQVTVEDGAGREGQSGQRLGLCQVS